MTDDDPLDPYLELELSRRRAVRRQIAINLGDAFASAAATYTNLARCGGPNYRKYVCLACGSAMKSIAMYVEAGLGRRARTLSRFMETVHRRMSRRSGIE